METNTQDIIKQRLNELPKDIKLAITTTDLAGKFETIANKHSLRIDQNGALQTETLLVMLGLESSADYIDNLTNELEMSNVKAREIAQDVNKEIFASIRESLRKIQNEEENEQEQPAATPVPVAVPAPTSQISVTPIEKVGNFTIIKPPVSQSPQYNHSNLDREAVLNDLENIEKLQPKNANNFVEHLLANPVSNPQQTIVKREGTPATTPTAPPVAQPAPQEPPKQVPVQRKYDADPYREQI